MPAEEPLKFLRKQCSELFEMKKLPIIGCNEEKCIQILRIHIKNECTHKTYLSKARNKLEHRGRKVTRVLDSATRTRNL